MNLGPTSSSDDVIPGSGIVTSESGLDMERMTFSEGSSTSCVGIIDMVNSTKITARLGREKMGKYYCMFLNWVAALVRGYGGVVVKNIGDGLLYYFQPPEGTDNLETIGKCLNCSLALTRLHPNINMKFRAEMLPELNYRISLDYGEVSLAKSFGSLTEDIFGPTVNVCAKINAIAAPNTAVLGSDLYQVSKNLKGFSFKDTKKSLLIDNRAYSVYLLSDAPMPSGLRLAILGSLNS